MDVREKLVELIRCADYHPCSGAVRTIGSMFTTDFIEDIASHLIAHGVTVQECGHWEDDHGDYVCSCCRTVFTDDLVWLVRGESNEPNYCPNCGAKMMPQPPKGE